MVLVMHHSLSPDELKCNLYQTECEIKRNFLPAMKVKKMFNFGQLLNLIWCSFAQGANVGTLAEIAVSSNT